MRGATPARRTVATPRVRAPELGRRSITILWGLPVVVVCLWAGGWVLAVGAALVSGLALAEFWALGRHLGVGRRLPWEVWAGPAALVGAATLGIGLYPAGLALALAITVTGGVVRAAAAADHAALRAVLTGTVWAALGLLYIPWLLGNVLLLRGSGPPPLGLHRAVGAVLLVWIADVAGFLMGGRFGRHRLAAGISPGKSVEGAVAAMAAAAAAAAAGAGLLGVPVWAAAFVGATLGAAGLAGDLWESLCKRVAGVKDSGGALPGHGGMLDRFDSLLLAAPVGYWLLARVPWAHLPSLWR